MQLKRHIRWVLVFGFLLAAPGSGCGGGDSSPGPRPSPAPFLSTTLPGIQLWLKADAITGLSDGASVANWPDSSGMGLDASQGTPAIQPIYVAAAANGFPAVRFSGTQYLTSTAIPATGAASRTVIAVVKNVILLDFGGGYNHVLHWGTCIGPTHDQSYGLVVKCNPTETQNGKAFMGNHYWLDGMSSNVQATPSTMLLENSYDGATDVFYVNGNAAATKTVALNTGAGSVVIGSRCDHTTEFYGGDIPEILIYSPALSSAQRAVVENYLAYKYAIY